MPADPSEDTTKEDAVTGPSVYWVWIAFLLALIVSGAFAYVEQLRFGLGVTAMRDQVSWGFYIGNFTFLVGVATVGNPSVGLSAGPVPLGT